MDESIGNAMDRFVADLDRVRDDFQFVLSGELAANEEVQLSSLMGADVVSMPEGTEEWVDETTGDLKRDVERLIDAEGHEQRQQYAVAALATLNELDSGVDAMASTLAMVEDTSPLAQSAASQLGASVQGVKNAAKGAWNWLVKHMKPLIKKVASGLWKIISNLLTPTSWTIEGTVGSSILGLGSATLSVTFGK